ATEANGEPATPSCCSADGTERTGSRRWTEIVGRESGRSRATAPTAHSTQALGKTGHPVIIDNLKLRHLPGRALADLAASRPPNREKNHGPATDQSRRGGKPERRTSGI